MKQRWLINLILLALVIGIAAFLHFRPQDDNQAAQAYEVSPLKMADIQQVKVEFPAKAPVAFSKENGFWMMQAPYQSRADQMSVQHIISIIAAKTKVKLAADDLAKFGLDSPLLKLKLTDTDNTTHAFHFGTYNPVTEEQYIKYQDAVYLLAVNYAEYASTQAIEMVDKRPLTPDEIKQIAGFDFSRLEQFAAIRLQVDIDADGKWTTNANNAKPSQNEMNEWLEFQWKQARAKSVEVYTPDSQSKLPDFTVKLKNGDRVQLIKMQESPEYLLARPDEGIIYHFPNDIGFSMLNPPLNLQ